MKIENGQTLLFIGDSITDCRRAQPLGQRDGLGEGYVAFTDSLLASAHPERKIRILNTGIGGNRVIDLEARWQRDVLDLHPDWLSVMIGINDVWRQFDGAMDPNQVGADRFETVYRRLLDRTRSALRGLVLMSPYFIETNRTDPMRSLMDAYGKTVRRLAMDFDAIFVDVQAAFDRYLAHRPTQSLAGDRIHVNKTGHMIIARSFLDTVGFE